MQAINEALKANISVSNMRSDNGREVPNQFIIKTGYGVMFRSYNSNIAFVPNDENIIYLGKDWDYSVTTGRYRNAFLGMNKKELEARIKNGTAVIMEDL